MSKIIEISLAVLKSRWSEKRVHRVLTRPRMTTVDDAISSTIVIAWNPLKNTLTVIFVGNSPQGCSPGHLATETTDSHAIWSAKTLENKCNSTLYHKGASHSPCILRLLWRTCRKSETKSSRKRVKFWEMIEVIDLRLVKLKSRRSDLCAARTMRLNLPPFTGYRHTHTHRSITCTARPRSIHERKTYEVSFLAYYKTCTTKMRQLWDVAKCCCSARGWGKSTKHSGSTNEFTKRIIFTISEL